MHTQILVTSYVIPLFSAWCNTSICIAVLTLVLFCFYKVTIYGSSILPFADYYRDLNSFSHRIVSDTCLIVNVLQIGLRPNFTCKFCTVSCYLSQYNISGCHQNLIPIKLSSRISQIFASLPLHVWHYSHFWCLIRPKEQCKKKTKEGKWSRDTNKYVGSIYVHKLHYDHFIVWLFIEAN